MATSEWMSVVLVDPFMDERNMYAKFLESEGFDVFVCSNPAAALVFVSQHHAAAVITRIRQAGEMNGVALTKALKEDPRTSGIPVVVISTYIQPQFRRAAEQAGCDRFLLLPCLPEELAHTLRQVVGRP